MTWIACGVFASVASVGLAMLTGAGSDLFRFCVGVAAMFFVAGIASGRGRFVARATSVALAGCAPVLVLAATRVAFASVPWVVAYVVTAIAFAAAGAAVRSLPRRGAIVVAAIAWFMLLDAGRAMIAWLVEGTAFSHVDERVPSFALSGQDGSVLRSADYHGKVVVLAFWASWCLPCRAERVELEEVADHYLGNPDVAVLWVDVGETPELLARGSHLTFAYDGDHVSRAFGVTGVPAIVILDRAGRLRVRHTGYDASERLAASLEREIDQCAVAEIAQ